MLKRNVFNYRNLCDAITIGTQMRKILNLPLEGEIPYYIFEVEKLLLDMKEAKPNIRDLNLMSHQTKICFKDAIAELDDIINKLISRAQKSEITTTQRIIIFKNVSYTAKRVRNIFQQHGVFSEEHNSRDMIIQSKFDLEEIVVRDIFCYFLARLIVLRDSIDWEYINTYRLASGRRSKQLKKQRKHG